MIRDALVVGINQYYTFKPLNTPAADAEAIAKCLETDDNFRVKRLPLINQDGQFTVDAEPEELVTALKLKRALAQLFNPKGTTLPETALFFFAGHGLREDIGDIQEGYLATSDINPKVNNYGVSLKWLQELLQNSPVKQQIVWLDCCYSGELLNFIKDADPGDRGKERDRCFIAAAREYELAYEETTGKHGILTGALLQGLDPEQSPNGIVDNIILTTLIDNLQRIPQRPLYINQGDKIILTARKDKKPADSGKPQPGICPYKGLQIFDFNEEDPKYFAGRDKQTSDLIDKVKPYFGNFVAVLGESGSGKSSLVRAGLLHQLQLGVRFSDSKQWHIYYPFTPADNNRKPLENLARVFIASGLSIVDYATELKKAQDLIATGAEGLTLLIEGTIEKTQASRVVLVIDQFEEIFTRCPDDTERYKFFDCLLGALAHNQLCLVIVMRIDFLGKCTEHEYAGLARYIQDNLVMVKPMTPAELEQAIIEPAKQVGLNVERSLVKQILKEVENSPGHLPLLQYTLSELWKTRRNPDWITFDEYNKLGGVNETLKNRADAIYESLSPQEQATAQWIFLELTQLGEGTEDTRKQVFKSDLITAKHSEAIVDKTLEYLADKRLVVTKALKERGYEKKSVTVVDVAHEALIRHWPQLREWLNENRDALRKKREIETAAKEWEAYNKSKGSLLKNPKLNTAKDYLTRYANKVPLSNLAQEFVQKSIKHKQTISLIWTGIGVVVILVLAGFGFYARVQWIEAEEQSQILLIEKLGTQSVLATQFPSDSNGYYEQALLLAIQAFKEKDIGTSRSNLLRVLQAKKQRKAFLYGHSEPVNSVAFSPDGHTLASGSSDGTVRLWDVQTRQPLGEPLVGHSEPVNSMAFSPNGKTLVSGSGDLTGRNDNTVRLWDVKTRKQRGKPLVGHSKYVYSVAFSPNGRIIASGSSDTVRLWDVKTRKQRGKPLVGHSSLVMSVAFSPDGLILASGSNDNTVILWNVQTRQPFGEPLVGHSGQVMSVAFSPDGLILASGSNDNTVILWDVKTRKQRGEPLVGHSGRVLSVAFSPDSLTLASGSSDTVILWDVKTKKPLGKPFGKPLIGETEYVLSSSVAFSPDGQTLASGSWDNTVRLWDVKTKQPRGEPLVSHRFGVNSEVNSVAFSPKGLTIASGSWDNVRLWNVKTRKPLDIPLGHSSVVHCVAFSPDGHILASGSSDDTVKKIVLWDVKTRKSLGELLVRSLFSVKSVAFTPDSKILASGSFDTVILWDVKTRKSLGELVGHFQYVKSVAFSPDGLTLASGYGDILNNGYNNVVRLWDVKTRKQRGKLLVGHFDDVKSVAFSPDGQILASGSDDNTVRLWNVETKKPLGEPLEGHSSPVTSVAFSPDGQTLASGSNDDGQTLASGSNDFFDSNFFGSDDNNNNTVILWDVKTRKPLGEPLIGHSSTVNSVVFSPVGNTFASGSSDGTVILWDVNPESWAKKACAIVNRNFSQKEWQKYMGNCPHEKTCPDLPKDTLGAIELTQQAIELLVEEGETEQVKAKIAQAREWDANVVFGENVINALGAIELTKQARRLLRQGQTEEAKAKFAEARELDANMVFGDEGI